MQDQFTKILKAISDPTRREIFHVLILVTSALPINQIATNFNMTRQGVTKHLKVLENANLVTINSKGRERYCVANAKPLKEVNKWLQFYEQFWDDSLNSLGDYLDNS